MARMVISMVSIKKLIALVPSPTLFMSDDYEAKVAHWPIESNFCTFAPQILFK